MKSVFFISAFLFFSLFLFAQHSDSTKAIVKSPVAEYFQENEFFLTNSFYKSIDTSLDGIQKYFPNNFPHSLSLANRKLSFNSSAEIGFRSGFEGLDLFGYNRNEIKYYRTRTPYTEVFAVFGQKKEQYAKLLHTQNINKQWNVALNMLRLRSEGFYQRQNCTDNNISLSSNFTSKNNRYSFLINGIVSSIKTDENGGVANDTVFESNLSGNKKLIPVNLLNARTRRGNRELTATQFLNFGKRDTSATDSSVKRIIPRTALSHSFHAKENWFVYEDGNPSSGFYTDVLFDSLLTRDSSHVFSFRNTFALKTYILKNISAELSFDQKTSRFIQYKTDSLLAMDSLFTDNTVQIEIGRNAHDKKENFFFWKAGLKNITSGNHQGDYMAFGRFGYILKNKQKITLTYTENYYSVPFIYSFYSSNNFLWENSFDNILERVTKLSYYNPKLKLTVIAKRNYIDSYVYLDSTSNPSNKIYSDNITIPSIFIEKNFKIKKFYFKNNVTWQKGYNPTINQLTGFSYGIINLPQFVTTHSLYYEDKWFKGATQVQLGFDVTYFSSYYADAYMPALGLYYLQNEKKIGNYPFIDFFFNMKVKHARIFFKTEHVNSGLMGAYYLAPHNPAPDRSIKVGINWTFYD